MTNWFATNVAPAIDADMAWQAELTRVYGKRAGDARYDARGRATDELARLGTVRDTLCETMRQAFAKARES